MSIHVVTIFFFNDTETTEIYTLSLHDALPISQLLRDAGFTAVTKLPTDGVPGIFATLDAGAPRTLGVYFMRSEEHTSELQSHSDLVCRLLLEKKNYNCQIHWTNYKTIKQISSS